VLPELKGKLNGSSIRVPTPNVSLVDLTVQLKKSVTIDEVHKAMKTAAEGPMKGVLQYDTEQTVSVDYNDNPHSSIFDSTQTQIIDGTFLKVFAWYDNEWGYSQRMVDVAKYLISKK
jgi:glyceraldehyde 3-phosphate dehydrogenase